MNAPAIIGKTVADAYAMETFVYFDIETIPCQSEAYAAKVKALIQPPGNIKKPESIEAWMKDNAESAAGEAVAKTSFDGGRGHVCCIAWAINDEPPEVRAVPRLEGEGSALRDFFNAIGRYKSKTLVGHNITGFDLPFLLKRAVILGIQLPPPKSFPRDPKPWDRTVFDTMTAWAGAKDRVSLDNLCDILGIPGKDGFDGSMVADAWACGDHNQIMTYCMDDVQRVRAIHQRFIEADF